MKNNDMIGVFDSGIGGLTVLESLIEKMPNENYLYIADQKNCPYGTKSDEEIIVIVTSIAKFFEKKKVKAIVVACNTASCFIDEIQKAVNVKVFGVIEPTVSLAIKESKNGHIGVFGTDVTIKKGQYQKIIEKSGFCAYPVACQSFVECLENHQNDKELRQKVVDEKTKKLVGSNIDTLIFGCTHFGLLQKEIENDLGAINYIGCGKPTAEKVYEYLQKENFLSCTEGSHIIYTTGDVNLAISNMHWFHGGKELPKHIDIEYLGEKNARD